MQNHKAADISKKEAEVEDMLDKVDVVLIRHPDRQSEEKAGKLALQPKSNSGKIEEDKEEPVRQFKKAHDHTNKVGSPNRNK